MHTVYIRFPDNYIMVAGWTRGAMHLYPWIESTIAALELIFSFYAGRGKEPECTCGGVEDAVALVNDSGIWQTLNVNACRICGCVHTAKFVDEETIYGGTVIATDRFFEWQQKVPDWFPDAVPKIIELCNAHPEPMQTPYHE